MKETHKMEYGSGGGTWYDGGRWIVKETPKTVIFTLIHEPFFVSNCPKKMRLPKDNHGQHCLRVEERGEYLVYPFRSGIPHVFTKI